MRRPNLLFIYTDEQRFDTLKAYGNHLIEMPHLDALADQACVFDRAYITQPVCTPSRSSILTGLYPHTNGCIANNIPLDQNIPCLPEMLDDHYETAHFGKWHLGDELFAQHGFDHWLSTEDVYNQHFRAGRDKNAISDYSQWLPGKGYKPDNGRTVSRTEAAGLPENRSKPAFLAEKSSRFIRENRDNPFCLFVNFLEPHMPFTGPRDDQYDPDSVPLPLNFDAPPTEQNHLKYRLFHHRYAAGEKFGICSSDPDSMRKLISRYWGLCSQVDHHCGTILNTLKDCGLWDDTIIVFTSDHGDMMGSHQLIAKCVMYEEAVRVPLLVKPQGDPVNERIKTPVSQVDLVPTLLEMMSESTPEHLEGRSFASALSTCKEPDPIDVLIEWNSINSGLGAESPDKISFPAELLEVAPRDKVVQAITDPIRTIITHDGRWKLNLSPMGEHEMYDLDDDPHECNNIFGEPDMNRLITDLVERLKCRQEHIQDRIKWPSIEI